MINLVNYDMVNDAKLKETPGNTTKPGVSDD